MSGIRIVHPGDERLWWWLGGHVRIPATGEDTLDRFMMEVSEVPPGGGPAPHIQNREDESFYVIDGGPVQFTAGNRSLTLGAGGFINIAKGTPHVFENVGEAPAKLLLFCFPAGFERFQFAAGEEPGDPGSPRPATDADRKRIVEVAPDFGIEMHPDGAAFDRDPKVVVAEPGAGDNREVAGQRWTTLASGSDTGGVFSMYRVAFPPGQPARQHFPVDVALYGLDGTLGIDADGEALEVRAGTLVQIPAGLPVAVRGAGAQRGTALVWAAPAHDLVREVAPP